LSAEPTAEPKQNGTDDDGNDDEEDEEGEETTRWDCRGTYRPLQ